MQAVLTSFWSGRILSSTTRIPLVSQGLDPLPDPIPRCRSAARTSCASAPAMPAPSPGTAAGPAACAASAAWLMSEFVLVPELESSPHARSAP